MIKQACDITIGQPLSTKKKGNSVQNNTAVSDSVIRNWKCNNTEVLARRDKILNKDEIHTVI
jgi:hypothetical protein